MYHAMPRNDLFDLSKQRLKWMDFFSCSYVPVNAYLLEFKLMIWKDVPGFEKLSHSLVSDILLPSSLPPFSSTYFINSYLYDFIIFVEL